jgi:segregation and condensation protein B
MPAENQAKEKSNLTNEARIESLLFYFAEPIKIKRLSEILNISEEEVSNAIATLQVELSQRGINLSQKDDEVVLVTNKEMSDTIAELRKEELSKDLSKAALETLSIIIYRGPIKRAEIDYIRGVNSQFILRLLLVRGLIEKVTNPKDERGYLYKPSFELMNNLGINKINEIPEFKEVNQDIDDFIAETKSEDEDDESINNEE